MAQPRPTATTRALSRGSRAFLFFATVLLLAANVVNAGYYLLPMSARVRAPEHPFLRPSGYIGQSAGIIAAAIFGFLWLYPLRKKLRWKWLGAIPKWLDVHITLALMLPLLVLVHAAWRVGGIIGLGFDAMMVVWASGIVGRYVYVRIPRSRNGLEMTLDEIADERKSLVTQLAASTGLDPVVLERTLSAAAPIAEPPGLIRALFAMMTGDFARWRMARELRRRWRHLAGGRTLDAKALDQAIDLATREMALEQQVRLLQATHRIFRWWHLLHKPVAITAAIAVMIHIAVVVSMGATWFW